MMPCNYRILINKAGCYFFCTMLAAFLLASCTKDDFNTSANAGLNTSTTFVKFDTVFTSIGSVTQSFTITNPNNQKLLLSSIRLAGGNSSPYNININGIPNAQADNIEIAAKDSIYIFVTVRINPDLAELPFLVQDSIEIAYNNNKRYVQLEAYGQNANFLRNAVITENRTWNNRLPYVILGGLQIDTNVVLTVDAGCKIYCHADAPWLVDGTLIVNGTHDQPVLFTGDRLDEDYKDLPASWPGIYFRQTSKNNLLNFAVINNAYQAVVAEYYASNGFYKLTMHQCTVNNAFDAGLLLVNTSVDINNSLISNCGNNINIVLGGNYVFTNCTVPGYSSYVPHKKPVLQVSNAALQNSVLLTAAIQATFDNCIFWGEETNIVPDEILMEKKGADNYTVNFNNCIYRATADPAFSTITACIKNVNPGFDVIEYADRIFNFHVSSPAAPGIDNGRATIFTRDLDNNSRVVGNATDIGCYEKQ